MCTSTRPAHTPAHAPSVRLVTERPPVDSGLGHFNYKPGGEFDPAMKVAKTCSIILQLSRTRVCCCGDETRFDAATSGIDNPLALMLIFFTLRQRFSPHIMIWRRYPFVKTVSWPCHGSFRRPGVGFKNIFFRDIFLLIFGSILSTNNTTFIVRPDKYQLHISTDRKFVIFINLVRVQRYLNPLRIYYLHKVLQAPLYVCILL